MTSAIAEEMKNRTLKSKLKGNKITIGSWITIGHPSIAEIMGNAGFEWLTIDMEHNSIDPAMMQTMIATIQSKDIAALIRVPKNEEVVIKHTMDAGADGVIVPMINSREDAIQAVNYVKYPPEGKRGVGLSRAQNYGLGFDEYKNWLKDHVVIVAQIEHIDGIHNITEIILTPGIDAVMIGPYDLSASLGYPGEYNRNEVRDALDLFEEKCSLINFPRGYHVVPPEVDCVSQIISKGYTFIAFSTDFLFMGNTARNLVNQLKKNENNIF